jgi:hypothetical protein
MSHCPVCALPVPGDPDTATMHVHPECAATWDLWWLEIKNYSWMDDEPQRPSGVSLAEWDAPFGGNVWEPGQVRGMQA